MYYLIKIIFSFFLFFIFFTTFSSGKESHNCSTALFSIDSNFSSGSQSKCEVINKDYIRLYISPEDEEVKNPSPWFAFRKSPHNEKIFVELYYTESKHRYNPKKSFDLVDWKRISESNIKIFEDNKKAVISFKPSNLPVYVSAQEVIAYNWYNNWIESLDSSYKLKKSVIGHSLQGREIIKLEAIKDRENPYILLVGRQHPPEVSGAIALTSFVTSIFSQGELSQKFLDNYNILIIPFLNPDGVENVHWRHNKGKKDLNRDWGFFTQPETKAIEVELEKFYITDQLILFLDFHSTFYNRFYIQHESEISKLPNFTKDWLSRSKELLKDYQFSVDPRLSTNNGVSKNYIFTKFKVPAVTYEVGDETDRELVKQSSITFAQELMKILLE